MNYSLGNMLGGAGALNADKLALNLQFAADKTSQPAKARHPCSRGHLEPRRWVLLV